MTDSLRRALALKGPDGKRNKDAIAETLIAQARAGSLPAIQFIYERIDGKMPDHVQADSIQRVVIQYADDVLTGYPAIDTPGTSDTVMGPERDNVTTPDDEE
ncbi:MAG: hypothetical protein HC926_05780 [Synechococcaceae cyanobacterium SM2_3_60]|nr:hypothetical protein [Synechococcaceae cyanobacterium SM2_3_60]